MNELIEYFKKIESRLAALEKAQRGNNGELDAQVEQALDALSEQMSAMLTSLTSIQEQLASFQEAQADLEARIDELESRAEYALPEEDNYEEEDAEEPDRAEEDDSEEEPEEEPAMDLLPIAEPEPEEPEHPASIVPKVTDIKKAISLGDRFLFQRELFGGNGERMAKTIADLNKLNSLDEADDYIQKRFPDWDKESSAYELFYNILKRRW